MTKKKIALTSILMTACITFMSFGFVGCGQDQNSTPIEKPGESTVIETVNSSPEELSATDVAYAYLGKQKNFTSYKSSTVGTTKAEKGIIKYEQTSYNKAYKNGDEYFEDSSSSSAFVKMQHQSFVKGDKVVYRNSTDGELNVSEKSSYKEVYGVAPDDVALGGYIMNDQSIKFAEKTKTEGDLLTYRFVLDGALAGQNAVKQMKEFGGLNGYPTFNSLMLYFTMKSDWTPVKLVVESNYNISIAVLGELTCTHNFTTEFSNVQGSVEIPSTEEFNAKLGTTPTEVVSGEIQKSPFMDIAEAFAKQDYNKGVHFGVDLGLGLLSPDLVSESDLYLKLNETAIKDKDYLDAVNLRLDLDVQNMGFIMAILPMMAPEISDVSLLASNQNLKTVSLYYIGDGNLYVAFKDNSDRIRRIITVDLIQAVASIIKGADFGTQTEDFDPAELVETLTDAFEITQTEDGTLFTLKATIVKQLNDMYDQLLNEIATAAGGGMMGAMVTAMLNADIDGVELKTVNKDGKLSSISFAVNGKKIDYEGTPGESIALLSFGLSIEGNLTNELANDGETVAAAVADDAAVAEIRNQIKVLEDNMWLGNSYVARVNALAEQYKQLTLSQRLLLPNSYLLVADMGIWTEEELSYASSLIDTHDGYKAEADEFIASLETIENWTDEDFENADFTFTYLSDCQIEYIGEENIQIYLDAVEQHNQQQIAA